MTATTHDRWGGFDLAEWARSVAPHLPAGPAGEAWTVEVEADDREHWRWQQAVVLRRDDLDPGCSIRAYCHNHDFARDRKVRIHGIYPGDHRTGYPPISRRTRFTPSGAEPKPIGVGSGRDPKAAGRDIGRRFALAYVAAFEAAVEAYRAELDHFGQARAAVDRVAALIGARPVEDDYRARQMDDQGEWTLRRSPADRHPHYGSFHSGYVELKLNDRTTVTSCKLEISYVSTELIEHLAAAIGPALDAWDDRQLAEAGLVVDPEALGLPKTLEAFRDAAVDRWLTQHPEAARHLSIGHRAYDQLAHHIRRAIDRAWPRAEAEAEAKAMARAKVDRPRADEGADLGAAFDPLMRRREPVPAWKLAEHNAYRASLGLPPQTAEQMRPN